jgi:hypothetical protein
MKLFDIYEELKHGFRMTATMRRTLIITMALAVISPAIANELRVWTSRQGSSIDAKLLKYEGKEAHLVTADTKVIKIKSADLSLSDRQYLVEFAAADSAILSETELGVPEKDVRISSKDFVRLDDKLWLGQDSEVSFDLLQTDHFLIATDGKVRPQALAEMSERLWHGMAFMHMDFRENWGDKRMLVVATSDESVYLQTGEWYIGTLRARDADEYADNVERTWALSASTRMTMTDEIIEKGTSEILVGRNSGEHRFAGELSTRFRCENGI